MVDPIHTGETIRASYLNRVAELAGKADGAHGVGKTGASSLNVLSIWQRKLSNVPGDRDCVRRCYNASGETVSLGYVCSITGLHGDGSILQFNKPQWPPYAIVLDTIENDRNGFVALSGGPYPLYISGGVIQGARLTYVEDEWYAEAGPGPWVAASEDVDGYCLAVFEGATIAFPTMLAAMSHMIVDGADRWYPCKYLAAAGTVSDDYVMCHKPYGVRVEPGDTGFLGRDNNGDTTFIPCHARNDQSLPLTVELRDDDPVAPDVGHIWLRTDL